MIRSLSRCSLALALAAGLAGCGGSTTMPAADGGSVADGGNTADGGNSADGGNNADGGRADGGADAGVGPTCNTLPVENLNTLGTVSGTTLRYTGNNNSTGTTLTVGLQVPAVLQADGENPGLCAFKIGHQRIFSYIATTNSTLRVSTSNPGTDIFFDTVVYVVDAQGTAATSACSRTAPAVSTFLGCNDDDKLFSGEGRRISSNTVTFKQVLAGRRVYIAVGGYASTTATANRDRTRERGTFELSVEELAAIADGQTCDARRLTNVCSDTSWCVQSAPSSDTGTCRPRGSVAGAACDAADACASPLVCDAESSFCLSTIADGQPCGPFAACTAGASTCVSTGERGFVSGTCRANGTAALTACRGAAPQCDTGLTCRTFPGSTTSVCLISATTTCSVWDTSCPQTPATPATNQDCVSSSATGTAGTCAVAGTVAGSSCTTTCSGAGLSCEPDALQCNTTAAAGQPCGPNDTCAAGSTCYLEDLNDRFHGRCFADGALGGKCRTSGTACTSPTVCSNLTDPENGRCVSQTAADGQPCSNTTRCSNTTSDCVADSSSRTGALTGTCRQPGTVVGASCRTSTTPACESGLSCSTFLPEIGICQTTASAGGACDPRYGSIRCPAGQVCRSTSLHLAGTCAAPVAEPNADANDRPWTLGTPPAAVTLPTAIKGSLALLDSDCYRVSVPVNGKLYAAVTSSHGVCADFDVRIDVYRYDTTLQRVRLLGTDSGSGLSGCPRIEGGDANGNFPWAVNGPTAAADWYVCVQSAADDRAPLADYVLSLASN